MFGRATHLCSRRGNNQPEQTIFSSTAASLSCPESTKQQTLMGKHTPSGSWRHLMEKDNTSNRLQAGNFAALSPDSTVSFPVKEFIQSLLSQSIHVNTLLMFSCHERRVFMCVCVCITDWLALKKKNQMWLLLMFRETHFPQYSDLWSTKMGF